MIYIWIRATVDWADERAFLAQVTPAFKLRLDVWNATFTFPYHVFRHELKTIAQMNLRAIRGARCAPLDEIPDGAMVLPVDDDDWFSPDVAETIEAHRTSSISGIHWTSAFIEVPLNLRHRFYLFRRKLMPFVRPTYSCTTNNYAVVKCEELSALPPSHMTASKWFDANPGRVIKLDRQLSVMNRSLASQTTLGHRERVTPRRELVAKLRQYQALYARPVVPELGWCQPYLARMNDLMREVKVRPA